MGVGEGDPAEGDVREETGKPIRKFPDQETFLSMVRAAGFENAKYRNLSMGIACLHSGWKI